MSWLVITDSQDSMVITDTDPNPPAPPAPSVCDVNTLLSNAGCFSCLPAGFFLPLKLVLLSQILVARGGTLPSVADLLTSGACFSCLSQGDMQAIKLVLLCNILGGTDLFVGSTDSPLTSSGDDIIIT